jgi:hypothetical protein
MNLCLSVLTDEIRLEDFFSRMRNKVLQTNKNSLSDAQHLEGSNWFTVLRINVSKLELG